jgi:hypothetical protein
MNMHERALLENVSSEGRMCTTGCLIIVFRGTMEIRNLLRAGSKEIVGRI